METDSKPLQPVAQVSRADLGPDIEGMETIRDNFFACAGDPGADLGPDIEGMETSRGISMPNADRLEVQISAPILRGWKLIEVVPPG